MRVRWFLSAAAFLCCVMAAQAQNKTSKEPVADGVAAKIEELIERNFYEPVDFPSFAGKHPTNEQIDKALADLHVSHTRRFMPGTVDYYEVADIYGPWRGASQMAFPPDGEAKYDGIAMNTAIIGGKRFVVDVYDGGAAKKAGILVGDEIVAVDGKPFEEIKSFSGQAGKTVVVTVRRTAKARPIDIPVAVASISPVRMYFDAIRASGRTIENGSHSIGYFRIWALASRQTNDAVEAMLRNETLSAAQGLILDLRGRWGGYSDELPGMLLEDFADIRFTMRDGRSETWRERWRKPIIVLVDEGTRSANEILACAIKKRGFAVVGKKTAGAVLSGRAFLLPDDSLLMLAAGGVQVDGEVLEGKGVVPDIIVETPIPYARGADPQLDVAVEQMARELASITTWRPYPQQRSCSEMDSAAAN